MPSPWAARPPAALCWRVMKLSSVVVAFEDCVYKPAVVQGRSMRPTMGCDDGESSDLVLAEKWSVKLYRYTRGDVVLLRSPECPNVTLAKRLIGLEGDWVTIPGSTDVEKIRKGHCWVEGDNEAESMDSRSKFGQVPLALIEGRVTRILWPPSRAGRVQQHARLPGRLLVRNDRVLSDVDEH